MKVFVTGATGFVGSHLCDLLVKEGHEVFSLVRSPKKAQEFKVPGTYVQGSLSSSGSNEWINELPADLDAVIHTAGIVHSMDTNTFYKINSECTKVLIDDLKSRFSNLKFTLVSSLAACGPSSETKSISEQTKESPVSEYGKSKLLAEQYTNTLSPKEWVVNIIRPPMVIGPRDPAVLDVFKMVESGVVVSAGLGSINNRYSFVCVFDLVECIYKTILQENKDTEVYFGSFPNSITLGELYNQLKSSQNKSRILNISIPSPLIKLIGSVIGALSKVIKIDIRLTPDKVNELLPSAWVCDSKKSQEQLKMNYQWNLERTIEKTLKDYKERNWL
jgi:nucleoside-diphosphate-sugar epimerase